MKKLKQLGVFAILGLSIISCGNDDDSDSGIETNQLVGIWQIETIKIDGLLETLDSCIALQTVEFDNNNNTYSTYYEFNGTDCVLESKDTFTYMYDNNFITVYDDEDTTKSEVLLLNTTKLEIKSTIDLAGMQIFEATYLRQ